VSNASKVSKLVSLCQLEPDVELAAAARQNATVFSNREHLRNVMMKTDFKS
jgi:hypothetical protein